MALKFKCKAKEEIPAELQGLYVEREGAFVLDVEGAVDKGLVEEARNSNVAPARERDELKRRFERSESEQIKAIAVERDGLVAKLMRIQVDQGVVSVATRKGLRPSAIPDITARALQPRAKVCITR
jgi:hypothetical protein